MIPVRGENKELNRQLNRDADKAYRKHRAYCRKGIHARDEKYKHDADLEWYAFRLGWLEKEISTLEDEVNRGNEDVKRRLIVAKKMLPKAKELLAGRKAVVREEEDERSDDEGTGIRERFG